MTVQGNGNMLIASFLTNSCPCSSIIPSHDFEMKQYQEFLELASIAELEEDFLAPATWRSIK